MYLYHDYLRKTAAITIALSLVLLTSVASAHAQFGPVTDLGGGIEPHCATGLNGTLHIVYVDTTIRYMTFEGGVPSAVETIPGSSGGRNPYIGVGVDGSVHVVWDTWHTAYYTNRVGGSWKNPQALPKVMPERNLFTQVAVASNGNAFTSHWSLTKYEGGYSLFSRVTNTGSSTPTITQVYVETAHNRPPGIIGPTPVSAGTGNIHILIGLPQTKHYVMDQNGGVTGGQNISRTPHQQTGEGVSGYFVGTDPGVAVAWWSGSETHIEGAVVNTLSRANANQVGLVAGQDCGEFPFPRAVYDSVRNKVYVLYPKFSRPALASWVPQEGTVQQLGYVSTANLSTGARGPGAGGIAVAAGGGVHIVYSTGGRLYHRTMDATLDDDPPSVPSNVQATALSWSSISITWSASTDNVGVAGYKVFRNGSQVGTSGTTSYTDTGLEPSTTYSYTVSAYDAAGNESAQSSPPATATTHPPDTEPPSAPTSVQATAQSIASIEVTWTASTDNVGVEGYKVSRNGIEVGGSHTTSYVDTGLQPNTTYSYTVSAYDEAGNESAQSSPPATATTPEAGAGAQWLWNADNWSGAPNTWVTSATSQWVEPNEAATVETGGSGNHRYRWTPPGTDILGDTSGVVTVNMPGGQSARGMWRTNNLNLTDVDDPNSPKYWDMYEGITFATKVYVDSSGPYGRRNIWLAVANNSTSGVGSNVGAGIMFGWDLQAGDNRVCIGRDDSANPLRAIDSTVAFKDQWSTWTISAKRVGNTIGWRLWINGVLQAADQELGGEYYTFVGYQDKSAPGSYLYVGTQEVQGSAHTSHWSHIGVTNAGVVPGWDGISSVVMDTEPPSVPTDVQATVETPRQVSLTWTASTDNVGVTGYRIFRNGAEIGISIETNYLDQALTPGTSYSYRISAFDAAGNSSAQSWPATVVGTMPAIDIAAAKQLVDETPVGLLSQVVTAIFDDYIYIGATDRYAGIRVTPITMPSPSELAVGGTVDIGGTLQTVNGERRIDNAVCVIISAGMPVFPGANWQTRAPIEESLDAAKLDAFRDYVGGRGVIVRNGYQVYSWGSYTARGDVASACKPIYIHFLLKALEDGNIPSLDQKVATWEPRLNNLNAHLNYKDRNITWRHMANQISCYGVAAEPGSAFNYNDYQAALFMDTLFEQVYGIGHQNLDNSLMHPELTDIIGCEDNPTLLAFGVHDRPGRLAISPRDFARFGLLYLHKGNWNGNQLLDKNLAKMAVTDPLPNWTPTAEMVAAEMIPGQRTIGGTQIPQGAGTDQEGSYSWLWWINGVNIHGNRHLPLAPHDMFSALGHGGRRGVIVLPGLDLIVSWNDTSTDTWSKVNTALGMLVDAIMDPVGQ